MTSSVVGPQFSGLGSHAKPYEGEVKESYDNQRRAKAYWAMQSGTGKLPKHAAPKR